MVLSGGAGGAERAPRHHSWPARNAGPRGAQLEEQLETCLYSEPADEWVRLLVEAGMGAHTLDRVTQLMQDPSTVAHGLSVTYQHSDDSMITTIGTEGNIVVLKESSGAVQAEGQLAVVIGKKARHVSKESARVRPGFSRN
jgi:crotonobetainyl-CoA:carnitine CoA-transferase CaiB-like acyl-CoA transferase